MRGFRFFQCFTLNHRARAGQCSTRSISYIHGWRGYGERAERFRWAVAANFLSAETSRTIWILIGISLALPKLLEHARVPEPEPASSSLDVALPRSDAAAG